MSCVYGVQPRAQIANFHCVGSWQMPEQLNILFGAENVRKVDGIVVRVCGRPIKRKK